MPKPAQLTGTFYLKLLGVEGLLDFATIRATINTIDNDLQPCSPPRTYSAGHSLRAFMTLPTPSRRENAEKAAAAAAASSEEDPGPGGSSGSGTWGIRRGSRHGRSKQAAAALTKQHSLDHIDDPSSELIV